MQCTLESNHHLGIRSLMPVHKRSNIFDQIYPYPMHIFYIPVASRGKQLFFVGLSGIILDYLGLFIKNNPSCCLIVLHGVSSILMSGISSTASKYSKNVSCTSHVYDQYCTVGTLGMFRSEIFHLVYTHSQLNEVKWLIMNITTLKAKILYVLI